MYCRGTDPSGGRNILSSSACSPLDRPLERKSCFDSIRCEEGPVGELEVFIIRANIHRSNYKG